MSEQKTAPESALGGSAAPAVAPAPTTSGSAPAAEIKFPDNWRDALDEDIKSDPSLQVFKDVPSVVKSYVHAQRMIGAEKLVIPGKSAQESDWEAVYNKLGRPESPDKYELKPGEGAKIENENLFKGFKETAHKVGLNTKQAQNLFDWYNSQAGNELKSRSEQALNKTKENIGSLQAEFGEGLPKELGIARAARDEFSVDGITEFMNTPLADGTLAGDHPTLIKFLNKVGKSLTEDKIRGESNVALGTTIDEANAKIKAMMSDSNGAYLNKLHPDHAKAMKESERLFQIINSKKA